MPVQTVAELFTLTSSAFTEGGVIPDKYSNRGGNMSPQLEWKTPPVGVKSFALICDDPDAPSGTWTHWVIFNIPASVSELPAGFPEDLPAGDPAFGALQGANSGKNNRYDGPRPPSGTHHYHFRLYALDVEKLPELIAGATIESVKPAIEKHKIGMASLMGIFSAK
ncbi:MAG: YbhB/YbcL family Raf kinase inhibitor-like protein [bacterium]